MNYKISKMQYNKSELICNIKNCLNWRDLFNLIQKDPNKYNVHFCLVHFNKEYLNGDLIYELVLNQFLNVDEISPEYDYYYDRETKPGSRTFIDYIEYLKTKALLNGNTVLFLRYYDASEAPNYVEKVKRIYKK